jgi:hypothetical protein
MPEAATFCRITSGHRDLPDAKAAKNIPSAEAQRICYGFPLPSRRIDDYDTRQRTAPIR